jgi:3-mercaptopyruvate sulfurtransferase SseA
MIVDHASVYGGHIGGSFSYPWRNVFDSEGNLRPLATIRREIMALDSRGFDKNRRIIVYCTRGVRASFAVAAFIGAGFEVAMYEGAACHCCLSCDFPSKSKVPLSTVHCLYAA